MRAARPACCGASVAHSAGWPRLQLGRINGHALDARSTRLAAASSSGDSAPAPEPVGPGTRRSFSSLLDGDTAPAGGRPPARAGAATKLPPVRRLFSDSSWDDESTERSSSRSSGRERSTDRSDWDERDSEERGSGGRGRGGRSSGERGRGGRISGERGSSGRSSAGRGSSSDEGGRGRGGRGGGGRGRGGRSGTAADEMKALFRQRAADKVRTSQGAMT
jgi:hypothetical protein